MPTLLKYEMHQVIEEGSDFIEYEGNQPHLMKDRALQSWAECSLCSSGLVVTADLPATLSHLYSLETVMK